MCSDKDHPIAGGLFLLTTSYLMLILTLAEVAEHIKIIM